jgi:hypothetical protein
VTRPVHKWLQIPCCSIYTLPNGTGEPQKGFEQFGNLHFFLFCPSTSFTAPSYQHFPRSPSSLRESGLTSRPKTMSSR